jgi:transposase
MNYNQKMDLVQKTKLFVGIDIAKHKHYVSLRDQQGKELEKPRVITNTKTGFSDFIKMLEPWDKNEILIGMEPTGHYWKCLAHFCKQQGYKPVLVNPFHVHRTKEVLDNTKRKTDSKDCGLISQMVREGKFLETLLLTGIYADLRELTKTRYIITQELTRIKLRITAICDEFLPEYSDCFSNITGKTSLALLSKFDLVTLKSKTLIQEKVELIIKKSRGKFNAKKALHMANLLSESIGVTEGITAAGWRLKDLIEQTECYKSQRDALDEKLEKKVHQTEESEIMLSMHGIGIITAAEFLGQTGPLQNFSNAKKLEKLAGLDLTENSSGKIAGKKSFSKRGRDFLRHTLYKITMVAIAHDNELKKLYDYKINTLKKIKMVAVGSMMIKVLRIIFGMVKNKSEYDGKRVIIPSAKTLVKV